MQKKLSYLDLALFWDKIDIQLEDEEVEYNGTNFLKDISSKKSNLDIGSCTKYYKKISIENDESKEIQNEPLSMGKNHIEETESDRVKFEQTKQEKIIKMIPKKSGRNRKKQLKNKKKTSG
jgi:hypothetical protein